MSTEIRVPKKPVFKGHSKFTVKDDITLKDLVDKFGEKNWIVVADHMPGRNSRQCRERWLNYLSPKLNTSEWSPEEDQLLIQKVNDIGTRWVKIAKFFEHRTDQMVKNRYYMLKRKTERQERKMRKNSAGLNGQSSNSDEISSNESSEIGSELSSPVDEISPNIGSTLNILQQNSQLLATTNTTTNATTVLATTATDAKTNMTDNGKEFEVPIFIDMEDEFPFEFFSTSDQPSAEDSIESAVIFGDDIFELYSF